MAAHDFDDRNHTGIVYPGILVDLGAGGGDILGGAGEAGAVIGAVQVVVNGLGNAHDAALPAGFGHIAADLVAGVHGIVSAVVEEVTNVVFFEDFQNPAVIGIVLVRIGNFVAAGAQLGRGGMQQQLQFLRILLSHVVQLVVQHALDSVGRAVNVGDFRCVQSGTDNAVGTGIDHGCGTARLTDDTCAFKFLCH